MAGAGNEDVMDVDVGEGVVWAYDSDGVPYVRNIANVSFKSGMVSELNFSCDSDDYHLSGSGIFSQRDALLVAGYILDVVASDIGNVEAADCGLPNGVGVSIVGDKVCVSVNILACTMTAPEMLTVINQILLAADIVKQKVGILA